jgi:hypothetical protein
MGNCTGSRMRTRPSTWFQRRDAPDLIYGQGELHSRSSCTN